MEIEKSENYKSHNKTNTDKKNKQTANIHTNDTLTRRHHTNKLMIYEPTKIK